MVLKDSGNFDDTVTLSDQAKQEFLWWKSNVRQKNGKRIRPRKVEIVCKTDASSFVGDLMMLIPVKRQMADGISMKKNFLFRIVSNFLCITIFVFLSEEKACRDPV